MSRYFLILRYSEKGDQLLFFNQLFLHNELIQLFLMQESNNEGCY